MDDDVSDPSDPPAILQAVKDRRALFARLLQNPDFEQWWELRDFVRTYRKYAKLAAAASKGRPPSEPSLMPFIEGLVRDAKRPITTRELYDKAVEAGYEMGGSAPVQNLAAKLSQSGLFVSIPTKSGAGWMLAPKEDREQQSV